VAHVYAPSMHAQRSFTDQRKEIRSPEMRSLDVYLLYH